MTWLYPGIVGKRRSALNQKRNLYAVSLVAILGILTGLSLFTFSYAQGASYLSDDPSACVNCHVMREQFDGWNRGTHQAVAVCNDCHTPHSFPQKWIVKGINGWNHSWAFTTGNFPNTIQIKPFNAQVAEDNCIDCHETMVTNVHSADEEKTLSCVACHGNVGHGR
jgi:cytochrome c nitrite reductase small subunit